jgi:uncharacterized protein (DUF1015 family)
MEPTAAVTPPYAAGPLRLAPFRARFLSPARVGDPASARLFSRPYRTVSSRLLTWQSRGQVGEDAAPALYLHEYTASGVTVRGLVGALDVSRRAARPQDRAVLPHEGIHPRQADELADRMDEMGLNPAPILLVHDDPAQVRSLVEGVAAREPDATFADRALQSHRIWAIRDEGELRAIDDGLAPTAALIADGHHRYAAYLRLQSRHPGTACDYGLAMLVDQVATPLQLGAIHRVLADVRLDGIRRVADALGLTFRITDRDRALDALRPGALTLTDGLAWATLCLPELDLGTSAVEYLHQAIIPAVPRGPHHIGYHHSVTDAVRRTRRGRDTAVLLPAPTIEQVWRTAAAGRLLPEKATSFQPKPSPGVLIRSLRDAVADS